MGNVSDQQIYDLALDVLRDVTRLQASVDEYLIDVRSFNREMSLQQRLSSEIFLDFLK